MRAVPVGRALKKMWIRRFWWSFWRSRAWSFRVAQGVRFPGPQCQRQSLPETATSTSTKRRPGHGGTADQGVAGVAKRRRPQPRPVPAEGKPCSTRSTMAPSVRMGQCERDSLDVRCGAVLLEVSAMTGNGTHVGHYCGRTACSWQICRTGAEAYFQANTGCSSPSTGSCRPSRHSHRSCNRTAPTVRHVK